MRLAVALLACALALAGCADSTSSPFKASLAASDATGTAPFDVQFTADAEGAEGTPEWSISFGDEESDNGTQLPANIDHTYANAGLYMVTLTITAGNGKATVTTSVNVTSFAQFTAFGTAKLACPQCTQVGANTGAGYRSGTNELDSYFVEIPSGSEGQPFTATSTGGNPDMVFRDGCTGGAPVGNPFVAAGPESGEVPSGANCALMWEPDSPGSTITLTIG